MLNHIIIQGRIVRDPELRRTGSGVAVTSFTLAVDRDIANKETGDRETDFIECVAWRGTGEFVGNHFRKGSMAVVSGRLQIRPWTDKDGNKRRTAEVVAENVYFGDSKKEDSNQTSAQTQDGYQGTYYHQWHGEQQSMTTNARTPANYFPQRDDPDANLPY